MAKRILIGAVGLIVLGVLGMFALAWRPAMAPIAPPPATAFPAAQVAQGRMLAGAGYCATCHTRAGGAALAGGYPLHSSFGTIYSTNITPDPETGIGRWSQAAFRRAMHEGVNRDGSHLFPAFPYDHFTKVSDGDVDALYAYLMTQPPVRAPAMRNDLPFPLNIRALQAGWKLLFFRAGRFVPDPSRTAEWNRGAYLAEGLSHCGGCHTPRNLLAAEQTGRAYAGGDLEGWTAPALTDANPAPVPWSQAEIFSYLRRGGTPLHGVAAGTMSPVVHELSAVPDADVGAIALYFADLNHSAAHAAAASAAVARAMAASRLGTGQVYDPDARLYVAACAACHYNSGPAPHAARPELALNTDLRLAEPSNFIRVVLDGVSLRDGQPNLVMPQFRGLTDADIARMAAYLRRTRANLPPWADMEKKVAAIRQEQR